MSSSAKSILLIACLIISLGVIAQVNSATQPKKKPAPTLSRAKYHDVLKAAAQVKSAISVGVSFRDFSPLLQNLQTEIELIPKPQNHSEFVVVNEFNQVLQIYKDSYALWKQQIESPSKFNWLPKGAVLVDLDIESASVADGRKYGIKVYLLPGYAPKEFRESKENRWAYIEADELLQAYWADAQTHINKANALLQ